MEKSLVVSLIMATGSACTARVPTPVKAVHEFDLVTMGVLPGATSPSDVAPCLRGRHEGRRGLLLSSGDSRTCQIVGGKVGSHVMGGECTFLEGVERCGQGFPLAVFGSGGAYQRVEPKPVTGSPAKAELLQAIVKGKVVEAATEQWRHALAGVVYEEAFVDALTWPGLDGAPTLVRLRARGEDTDGPWVAIAQGTAGTMVGPFTMEAPTGFTLDGRSYLSVPVAGCHHCGGVGTEVHLIENGRLRKVLESYANAN